MLPASDPREWIWPWKAYHELVFLFASVLNEIQNGPVSAPHVNLAKLLGPDDAVLTFNWDTLMDRALEQVTPWNVDTGYGISPREIFDTDWRLPLAFDGIRGNVLVKLHGSTNWLTSYPTRENLKFELTHSLGPETVYVFRRAVAPYACFAGRFMSGYEPFSYGYYPPNISAPGRAAPPGHVFIRTRVKGFRPEGLAPDGGLVSMPLIIPPVRDKTYELFGELFTTLWNIAEDRLVEADEIIVIGYSFPRTDGRSRTLFKRAFMRRDTMPKVTIIDPAPKRIADIFHLDFGIGEPHLRVITDYFSETFDLVSALSSSSQTAPP